MHGSRWHAIPAAIVAAALAACSSVQQGMIERGYSPAYAEGYDHGCASGKATSGDLFAEAQKDEARYAASEGDYAQGWDAGYQKCRADMRAMVNDARTRNPSRSK